MPDHERINAVNMLRVSSRNRPSSKLAGYLYDLIYSLRVARIAPRGDIIVTNTFFLPIVLWRRSAGAIYVHVARMPRRQMGLYRRASRFHAVSEQVRQAVQLQSPALASKLFVVPNALAPAFSNVSSKPMEERVRIVLYVGRVAREKGLELLIQGFSRAQLPGWRLVVMGPWDAAAGGDGDEYRDELSEAASSSAVDLELRPPTYDLTALVSAYSEAPIFVYPSVAEGESFGMAPLEAMACGCAVIVSDLPCFLEFARPGENCLSFDHRGDHPAATLAVAIRRLAADPDYAQELATAGRAEAGRFTIGAIADALLADFNQTVAARNGG